ncbi:MAG: Imm63 family immunity protein [Verrucomicrobiota bacterium]
MNDITTVEGIGKKFREYVSTLDLPQYYKTFHTTPQHDGSPHIESEGNEFHFVVTERGEEFQRIRSFDPNEILYLLLSGVTHYAATQHELKNRIEGKDCREIFFPHQEQLLHQMNPTWGERKKKEHEVILSKHPLRNET